jgi:hypothetical protein
MLFARPSHGRTYGIFCSLRSGARSYLTLAHFGAHRFFSTQIDMPWSLGDRADQFRAHGKTVTATDGSGGTIDSILARFRSFPAQPTISRLAWWRVLGAKHVINQRTGWHAGACCNRAHHTQRWIQCSIRVAYGWLMGTRPRRAQDDPGFILSKRRRCRARHRDTVTVDVHDFLKSRGILQPSNTCLCFLTEPFRHIFCTDHSPQTRTEHLALPSNRVGGKVCQ